MARKPRNGFDLLRISDIGCRLSFCLALVREFDENVLEIGHQWPNLVRMDANLLKLVLQFSLSDLVVDQRADGASEDGGRTHERQFASSVQRCSHVFGHYFEALGAFGPDLRDLAERVRSAVSDQFAVINVSQM